MAIFSALGAILGVLLVGGMSSRLTTAQPPPPVYDVNITLDGSKVKATTGDGLVSANFDWHLDSEEYPAWVNSSVLVLNLKDPKMIYLAKQLAPGHLRVVGTGNFQLSVL